MEIIAFIEKYWSFIAPLLLLLVELILFLCKKRSKTEIIDNSVMNLLVQLVSQAESLFLKGEDKLKYVLDEFFVRHPDYKRIKDVEDILIYFVDRILSTPTKKGGPGREEVK